MLTTLTEFARGPLLKLSLLVMTLGLLRVLVLQVLQMVRAYRLAGDKYVSWGLVMRRNLEWLLPWRYLKRESRRSYNVVSLVFHVGIIVVPLFLAGHIAIWKLELGISWPALPEKVADVMTIVTAVALVALLVGRMSNTASRGLSKTQDWVLPVLCFIPFVTGFLVSNPTYSPFDAQVMYLLHLLSAEVLLMLVPFTKLVHMVLFWTSQSSSELGWRFTPGAGHRVRATLGKEGEPV